MEAANEVESALPSDDPMSAAHARRTSSARARRKAMEKQSRPHPAIDKIPPGAGLKLYQLKAILIKRFHSSKRNIKGIIAEV